MNCKPYFTLTEQVTSQPLQTVCTVSKLVGGEWLGNCGTFDGQKFVCLDKLYNDIMNDRCLVYSFGIANDWSFEEVMAGMGCKVRAFDPTTIPESKPDNENITFEPVGLGHKSGEMEVSKMPSFLLSLSFLSPLSSSLPGMHGYFVVMGYCNNLLDTHDGFTGQKEKLIY